VIAQSGFTRALKVLAGHGSEIYRREDMVEPTANVLAAAMKNPTEALALIAMETAKDISQIVFSKAGEDVPLCRVPPRS
jgi:hypothetical protein